MKKILSLSGSRFLRHQRTVVDGVTQDLCKCITELEAEGRSTAAGGLCGSRRAPGGTTSCLEQRPIVL